MLSIPRFVSFAKMRQLRQNNRKSALSRSRESLCDKEIPIEHKIPTTRTSGTPRWQTRSAKNGTRPAPPLPPPPPLEKTNARYRQAYNPPDFFIRRGLWSQQGRHRGLAQRPHKLETTVAARGAGLFWRYAVRGRGTGGRGRGLSRTREENVGHVKQHKQTTVLTNRCCFFMFWHHGDTSETLTNARPALAYTNSLCVPNNPPPLPLPPPPHPHPKRQVLRRKVETKHQTLHFDGSGDIIIMIVAPPTLKARGKTRPYGAGSLSAPPTRLVTVSRGPPQDSYYYYCRPLHH